MKEFSKFETFTVLGSKVKVLCTDTDHGVGAVAEINDDIYYIGSLQEHRETGRLGCKVEDTTNMFLALVAWEGYFDRQLKDDELIKILSENENAGLKINPI
jgi:hypothetical protein